MIACGIALYQVFVGARLHVTGGVLRGGRAVEGEASIAGYQLFYCIFLVTFFLPFPPFSPCLCFLFLALTVLDTAAGVWLDRNGIVSSSRSSKGHDYDPSLELMRRCRHAAAAVSTHIFIYGGLRGGKN